MARPQVDPKALSPRFRDAVELVRKGMDITVAASISGVTASALRSACAKSGVAPPTAYMQSAAQRAAELRDRNQRIVNAWNAKASLDEITADTGLSPHGIQQVLRAHGIIIPIPKRSNRRSGAASRDSRIRRAAQSYLGALLTAQPVTIYEVSRSYRLSVYTLQEAIKKERARISLDAFTPVSDTRGQ